MMKSNYDGNDKAQDAVLEVIIMRGPIHGALIEYDIERDYGLVLFHEDVESVIDALRLKGHCIIENDEGYKLAEDIDEMHRYHLDAMVEAMNAAIVRGGAKG